MTKTPKTRVVIVGGGFGGVKAALELAAHSDQFDITLISERPDFRYYPTLYHTATGGSARQSRIQLKELFKDKEVYVKIGTATKIDRKHHKVVTDAHATFAYDALILSLGTVTNFFGISGMQEFSYGIKSVNEAKRFKAHLHKQLADGRKPDLNYVVVGGGPTGIELAGALPDYLRHIAERHGIKRKAIHVDLVEAAPSLVPRMPKAMGKAIARRLRKLGVRLYLNSKVEGTTADELTVNGKPIQSHTVVWTAGVANHPFFKANNFILNERGKVTVDGQLQAELDVYVIGDNADTEFSGLAQTALYDAIFVADNLKRKARGEEPISYVPKRPIYVVPVGENWAAVLWGKQQIYGWVGWLLRLAADAVAFKDYQPWWKAGRQWLTEFDTEEECSICK